MAEEEAFHHPPTQHKLFACIYTKLISISFNSSISDEGMAAWKARSIFVSHKCRFIKNAFYLKLFPLFQQHIQENSVMITDIILSLSLCSVL